jgi:poly(A) polymerase
LIAAGHEALFAGGCVRDACLGRPFKDIDIATSATPEQVEALFAGHTVAVGKAFGVVLVLRDGYTFDVATFRTDGEYADGRHPADVRFANPKAMPRGAISPSTVCFASLPAGPSGIMWEVCRIWRRV